MQDRKVIHPQGMTEVTYLDSEGTICPYCESTKIHYSGFETEGIQAWQNAECQSCLETFEKVFQLAWYN